MTKLGCSQQRDLSLSAPPGERRVLVAEDDAVYRRLLQRLLQRTAFQVTTVSNGGDALRAAQNENAPRLLILDWVMPGMCGPEVCRRLRNERKACPYQYILLLTSKDAKTNTVTGLESGADDYLTKPFDTQELLARLRAGTRILELQDRLLATQKELEFQATHDCLTGLWNRLAWKKLLAAEFARAHRDQTSVAVLMVDIDHFKSVNDTFGHSAGDAVLQTIGETLRSLVRSYDYVGRYGGEEFIILAQQLSSESVCEYAERVRTTLAQITIIDDGHPISITVSIGVAFIEHLWNASPETVVVMADHALYEAKHQGRNRIFVDTRSTISEIPASSCRSAPLAQPA